MATSNAVFQLTHTYTVLGQECNNVYFYQRETGITASAQALAEEWVEQILPAVLALQVSEAVTSRVSVVDLFDVADTGEVLLSAAGTAGGGGSDQMPSFVAAAFILDGETAITKNGAKRIAGMKETKSTNNVWTDSSFLSALGDAAVAMGQEILGTLSAEWFFPVIVKRIPDGDNYRLPATLAEAFINAVVDVLFDLDVTTQNSRKSWVGV